jgi:IclR family KDG regulon transcriptional repressor
MDKEDSTEKQTSAVSRTITVLEILSRHKSINLEQLAKETELPKATLLRFITTLTSLGYVFRDSYDQYSLTLKMFSVGSHSLEHMDLIRVARPIAEELAETTGETVHMGILEDDAATYVLKIETKYTIRMYSRIGKSIPLYCTSIGKILLAGYNDEERAAYIAKTKLVPFTPNTIKTASALKTEINAISKDQYAFDREEHEPGISCIAAPVRDYTGAPVAALSVSWPLFRYEKKRESEYIQTVREAALKISKMLGSC